MTTPQHSQKLIGKTALITGGSRSIGKAIALKLAAEGAAFIAVHYRNNQQAANETVAMIQAQGVKSCALQADFAVDGYLGAQKLWQDYQTAVMQQMGHDQLDILINNAGIGVQIPFTETTTAQYQEIIAVNLTAPFFLIQMASPHLPQGARIINLSSALTRLAAPKLSAYALSKGAINTLTLALAPDFGARGITINAVAPGVIDTDMNAYWLADDEARREAEQISVFSRLGQGRDVADIVAFLSTEESRWITGQVIDASGGSLL